VKIKQSDLSSAEYWTNYRAIPWYVEYVNLYDFLAQQFQNGDIFVEIGGLLGKSAAYMGRRTADMRKDVNTIVVDNLCGLPDPAYVIEGTELAKAMLDNFVAVGVEKRCHLLTMSSPDAAALFADKSLAAVYVDGDHSYEGAKADILAWWPKIRPGGYMCGHDYVAHMPGVVRAVTEIFGGNVETLPVRVVPVASTFSVRKPAI
jgi:predicted O-methyltransferase YrrM